MENIVQKGSITNVGYSFTQFFQKIGREGLKSLIYQVIGLMAEDLTSVFIYLWNNL